ncbi:hypothetical protein [Mucilaginibacter auburnensis]|uniref:Uncharacterized protein n=1 Tax=Mucilaginibacter auburnensis TaxID=1457233 RepID=A0A2H9VLL3_9SPHI|nr:hypothetical protein [Mucilaginibacter auburnensis]PJJ79216.1 hypothetical protein CLV57_2342 [Mucilaginibacter auburnensis]
MEGIHERFLATVGNREFEVVPNIGHYAILENDVTVAEISIDDDGKAHINSAALADEECNQLLQKIQDHINTGLTS